MAAGDDEVGPCQRLDHRWERMGRVLAVGVELHQALDASGRGHAVAGAQCGGVAVALLGQHQRVVGAGHRGGVVVAVAVHHPDRRAGQRRPYAGQQRPQTGALVSSRHHHDRLQRVLLLGLATPYRVGGLATRSPGRGVDAIDDVRTLCEPTPQRRLRSPVPPLHPDP